MDWRDIPSKLFIGEPGDEELWTVRWREAGDPSWVSEAAAGLCDFETLTISLDERLKADPTDLEDTWNHELAHACLHYWTDGRPKAFDAKLEEKVIAALIPILIRARRSAEVHK